MAMMMADTDPFGAAPFRPFSGGGNAMQQRGAVPPAENCSSSQLTLRGTPSDTERPTPTASVHEGNARWIDELVDWSTLQHRTQATVMHGTHAKHGL